MFYSEETTIFSSQCRKKQNRNKNLISKNKLQWSNGNEYSVHETMNIFLSRCNKRAWKLPKANLGRELEMAIFCYSVQPRIIAWRQWPDSFVRAASVSFRTSQPTRNRSTLPSAKISRLHFRRTILYREISDNRKPSTIDGVPYPPVLSSDASLPFPTAQLIDIKIVCT